MNTRTSIIRSTCALMLMTAGLACFGASRPSEATMKVDIQASNDYLPDYESNTTYLRIDLNALSPEESIRPPINIALVIDKSGSMQGSKLEDAKTSAIHFVERLSPNDIVSVVTYSSSVQVLVPATKATDKASIVRQIRSIRASGNTALFAGVSKGASEVRKFLDEQRVHRIILLSDGLANEGPSTPRELGQLGRSLMREGISVSTLGLGYGYNEDLMTQLAYNSDGNHVFVENSDQLVSIFDRELDDLFGISAKSIKLSIRCSDDLKVIRLLGREGNIRGQNVDVYLNQLTSGHPRNVLLEVQNLHERSPKTASAEVEVEYYDPFSGKTLSRTTRLNLPRIDDPEKVRSSINTSVLESATLLIAAANTEEAIALRDSGRIAEARQKFEDNTAIIQNALEFMDSDLLQKGLGNSTSDAESVRDDNKWARSRKVLREEQNYLKTNQAVQSSANRYVQPTTEADKQSTDKP